jgi:multidrug efflux pump subunit AcrA (membrane-fusion protein)
VDAASAAVTVADQALAQATIASPIAGTVVGVNLAVGDSVQSASPTANIVVQGAGGFEVSTTVGVDQITHVAVGQRAMVTPDGSHTALDGKVSSIGVTPDPNASNTAYLVVIGLANPNAALHNGATGTVTIVTQSAKSALAVPTSAVTTTGTRHTVEVVNGDAMQPVRVQVGVVGDSWTEIKSGLSRGQRVVLADMSQALPGSATASSNSASANQPVGGTVRRFPGGFTGGGPGR